MNQELSEPGRARNTDPDTSHAAAAAINIGPRKQRILEIITDRGLRGTTLDDLEDAMPGKRMVSYSSVPARLEEDGLIHDSGLRRIARSGHTQKVWFPGFGLSNPRAERKRAAIHALHLLKATPWAAMNQAEFAALAAVVPGWKGV